MVSPLGVVTTARSFVDAPNSQMSDEPPDVVSEPSVIDPTAPLPGTSTPALSMATAPARFPVPLSVAPAATAIAVDESGPLTRSSPPDTAVLPV